MQNKADDINNLYSNLQNEIFNRIIFYLRDSNYKNVGKDNVLSWQIEQLSKMGMLNSDVVKMLSQVTGVAEKKIKSMIVDDGITIQDEMTAQLVGMTHKSNVKPDNEQLLNGLLQQTYSNLNNVVNQSLISRNAEDNGALRAYQDIVNKSTVETITGLKTHEQAILDNVQKWVDSGLKTNLVDKAGHRWSLEGYSRMVINSTAHSTFNQVRMSTMSEFEVTLASMSSHAASRPACAPIQGMIVNTVPRTDKHFNPRYPTIYDHGYGYAWGTQGANCKHELYPYIEGVNTNPFHHPDTKKAIKNGKIQQKQRGLERLVRQDKKMIAYAKSQGDEFGVSHYKSLLSGHRAKIREIVKDHDFLHRDYSREKVITKVDKYIMPDAKNAVFHKEKLTKYALDPTAIESGGASKAKVFQSALGYNLNNYTDLMDKVYNGVTKYEAIPQNDTEHGQKYRINMPIKGPNGNTRSVRTAWIKDPNSGELRLTSIFVNHRKKG